MADRYEMVKHKLASIKDKIELFEDAEDITKIRQIYEDAVKKLEDCEREDRKLNIGVIGRVKAGKSSFLNTLLFDGKEILPKAATPKTAALTKMEYAGENRIVVEFYSKEEWEQICFNAERDGTDDISRSSHELVMTASDNGLDVEDILEKQKIDKNFENYDSLLTFLNDYVGENGSYTPVVRSVVIYMNRDEFQDVSIVDTPGLNDPVPSRTQRTKEFIKECDVVFFLSRASSFIDNNDWNLLCRQLPQEGIQRLVIVASQYDAGLRDVLAESREDSFMQRNRLPWETAESPDAPADVIQKAKQSVNNSLKEQLRKNIEKFEKQNVGERHSYVLDILKAGGDPIMTSSRTQDMSKKDYAEYTEDEKKDYEYWKKYYPENERKEAFARIGNFAEIEKVYQQIKEEKSEIIRKKRQNLVPSIYAKVNTYLEDVANGVKCRLEFIKGSDWEGLEQQQEIFEKKINGVQADVLEVFGDTIRTIKEEKIKVNQRLREMSIEACKLETHTGTEVHHGSHTSYRFNLGPIHLGRQTESYSYTTTYTYLAASDALDQINVYGKKSASEIEDIFVKIVNMKEYRRKLLNTVIQNFDTSDKNFDVNYFKSIVQRAINRIDFPEVHINVDRELEEISSRFSGEIRSSASQDEFRNLLSCTVETLYAKIIEKVDVTIREFSDSMQEIQDTLCDNILNNIEQEFTKIKDAIESKDQEIANNEKYLNTVTGLIEEIQM